MKSSFTWSGVSLWLAVGVSATAPLFAQDVPPVPPATVEAEPPPAEPSPPPAADIAPSEPLAPEPEATPEVSAEVAADPASDELLAAELAKLGLDDSGQGPVLDTSLKLSGFADFGIAAALGDANGFRASYERFPAFAVGNFNVYIDKPMTETLRMFGEVRLTLLPNGTAEPGSVTGDYVSTWSQDYANFKRALPWSGIYIPRVYLEWAPYRFLSFRAGMFLTPYGIWNVDHGSPTVITAQRPFIIGQALFPERQTGIEAFGQVDLSAQSTLGYHLTLSNGLGPVMEYRDMDANKAIGARVFVTYDGLGQLRVGGSAFYGTSTTANERGGLGPNGDVMFTQVITNQFDVLSLAADVEWRHEGLVLQAEVITQQKVYEERGRPGAVNPLFGSYLAAPDDLSWGLYGLIGYRFDWFGIMPYALLQTVDTNTFDDGGFRFHLNAIFTGFNIRPVDVLVIKLEYSHTHFPDGFLFEGDQRMLQAQIAWAF